ncbi:MAG: class I SAM-dependent methyltransferase [Theionarchaea archaeon]|nr:MAG: hypothetical protein AYK19_06805 [Theionarchaea archaeon DG-70-1]MBU7029242.1 class I SAM-dependent methyltransferase [Theionarchaea archaeon]
MNKTTKYTEKEAELLDKAHKKETITPIVYEGPAVKEIYMREVLSHITPTTRLLDLCCGAGNFLQSLSGTIPHGVTAGIDISSAMVQRARKNTYSLINTIIVQGNITHLPFSSSAFNIVTCRMGPDVITEVYRVLKPEGWFIHMGAGYHYNPEIEAVFSERYTFNPYESLDESTWKETILKDAVKAGFHAAISDFTRFVYYTPEGLTKYLEMIPVVKEFESKKDQPYIKEIAQKYRTSKGIKITRQYFILKAKKSF